jgi:hypothetical protein
MKWFANSACTPYAVGLLPSLLKLRTTTLQTADCSRDTLCCRKDNAKRAQRKENEAFYFPLRQVLRGLGHFVATKEVCRNELRGKTEKSCRRTKGDLSLQCQKEKTSPSDNPKEKIKTTNNH